MIGVIDYGMGNLRSVSKALARVGAQVEVTDAPARIAAADAVVLPGVGAFARCMENLESRGLAPAVREATGSGRPFLGICVGMQILFERSEEFGRVDGLGILPGAVRRFEVAGDGLKVPHMGWNRIEIRRRPPHLAGIEDGSYFYFVHSFYAAPGAEDVVATTTGYGSSFCSSAWRDNVYAVQFHPEKSQAAGLKLLENFVELSRGRTPRG